MLELSRESINFEPASSLSTIFYDDANQKIITVRGSGAMGVTGKGPSPRDVLNFRLADKGEVKALKISPSLRTAAVQRAAASLDFVNIHGGEVEGAEYSQPVKAKNSRILGFQWTGLHQILIITDKGIELYTVLPEKQSLKSIRSHNISINWYVYDASTQVLLVSSGVLGTQLHPFAIKAGNFVRMGKVDIEHDTNPQPPKLVLLDRDVTFATIYGKPSILVLRHSTRGNAQVIVYELFKDASSELGGQKAHELDLGRAGKFAVQVLDNLILVHHQTAKLTLVYDLAVGGTRPRHPPSTAAVHRTRLRLRR